MSSCSRFDQEIDCADTIISLIGLVIFKDMRYAMYADRTMNTKNSQDNYLLDILYHVNDGAFIAHHHCHPAGCLRYTGREILLLCPVPNLYPAKTRTGCPDFWMPDCNKKS